MTDRARLRLHDTAAGVVRDFVPLRPGHVSIYLCGATVQGLPHIGHVRSGVAFDILRRWLLARRYMPTSTADRRQPFWSTPDPLVLLSRLRMSGESWECFTWASQPD